MPSLAVTVSLRARLAALRGLFLARSERLRPGRLPPARARKPAFRCRHPLPLHQRASEQENSLAAALMPPAAACRELRASAADEAAADSPSLPPPGHRRGFAHQIACGSAASPPTDRASLAGGANLAFVEAHEVGAGLAGPHRAIKGSIRWRKPGEPGKGCSIKGRATDSRRPPQVVHTFPAGMSSGASGATRPPRSGCRLRKEGNRTIPTM